MVVLNKSKLWNEVIYPWKSHDSPLDEMTSLEYGYQNPTLCHSYDNYGEL